MREILIIIGMAFLSFFAQQAFATNSCSLSPNNGSCTIDSTQIATSVENSNATFSPGDNVTMHIIVTNNGTTLTSDATITDIFPQFVDFTNGPGHFDSNSRQLNFPLPELLPGASQTFTLTGVVNGTGIYTNQPTCVTNTAFITINNQSAQDSSQFCIQPPLANAMVANNTPASPIPTQDQQQSQTSTPSAIPTQSPATGTSPFAWMLIVGTGLGGLKISKYANKQISKF